MSVNVKLIVLLSALVLGGCSNGSSTSQRPSYSWNSYQTVIYQYYQPGNTSPLEQIATLERSLEISKSRNLPPPPGLHAHLGLLYNQIGNVQEAYNQFTIEKRLYPESTVFMDFLLKQPKRRVL